MWLGVRNEKLGGKRKKKERVEHAYALKGLFSKAKGKVSVSERHPSQI